MYKNSHNRPKFLNLFTLAPKMAITAKVSILHRLTGVLLFLGLPLTLVLLHKSLTSSADYRAFYQCMNCPLAKIIEIVILAAFVFHACAGTRFLFLDIDRGVEIKTARRTATIVIIISLCLSVALGVLIW